MGKYSTLYKKRVQCYTDNEHFKRDREFMAWMDLVEYIVLSELKMELLELPDEMYMINFESGVSPEVMADKVIHDNMIFIDDSE